MPQVPNIVSEPVRNFISAPPELPNKEEMAVETSENTKIAEKTNEFQFSGPIVAAVVTIVLFLILTMGKIGRYIRSKAENSAYIIAIVISACAGIASEFIYAKTVGTVK